MEYTLKLNMTEEEARARDAEMEQMLEAMRQANEHIARRQQETKRLQEEVDHLISEIKEPARVGSLI